MIFFCCFITNKNFGNCRVFPTVKNMSHIFVTCYLKNNHIKCFSFLEDCRIFLQDMHFSWPINICSALAVQEDEVKTSRVWFSLQPPGTRGALVKTETGESLHGDWACSSPGSVSSVGHTAGVLLSWGVNSLTAQNCWLWGKFCSIISGLLSLSIQKLCEQLFKGKLIWITKNVNVK